MDDVLKTIGEIGVVPVVKIQDAENAVPLGRALLAGDLPLAEITFRTDAAAQAIKNMSEAFPEMLIGAGTVLSVDQVKQARAAGARFMVSPGFNPGVVDYCLDQGIPVTPGVNSPTTIEMALERNLKVLKFFPAEASGGLNLLKAMAGPYGGVSFIPTGGVNTGNLQNYLSSGLVHACGGTWIAKADMIAAGKFDEITRQAREAVALALGFSLAESPEGAGGTLLSGGGFRLSLPAASSAEGSLVVFTLNMARALAYLRRKGIAVLPETAVEKKGRWVSVAVDPKAAGCALRLEQS
jgi:2-dehydro-3-deoxyphosphogluconate aldolase/(4S)-4-hydroxy-2-oxoglutarate aldolase